MQCISKRTGMKRRYNTAKEADSAAEQMEKIHGNPYTAYLCKNCGFWHVGTRTLGKGNKVERQFKVKNVYMGNATLYRKDGTTWNAPFKGNMGLADRMQHRIEKGATVEATVEFPRRGAPVVTDFMELSKNDEMSLEEQRREYVELGGDY